LSYPTDKIYLKNTLKKNSQNNETQVCSGIYFIYCRSYNVWQIVIWRIVVRQIVARVLMIRQIVVRRIVGIRFFLVKNESEISDTKFSKISELNSLKIKISKLSNKISKLNS